MSLDPAQRNQTTKSTKDKEVSSNKPKVFTYMVEINICFKS